MLRQTFYLLLIFLAFPSWSKNWLLVAPGVEYQDLNSKALTRWSHIHVFRINLQKNTLELINAKALSKPHAPVREFARVSRALLAINGGFFDTNYNPIGLRINRSQHDNPLKNISWWGIFYIKNNQAYLSNVRQFNYSKQLDFAIQAGPRLIINNKIPSLKPGYAERSALGIDKSGQVIILITENSPMTTTALAQLMKSPPINCKNALNLDGGSSTQLYAQMGALKINHMGYANVADAVIVKPQ